MTAPGRDALQAIDACAARIAPDDAALAGWHRNYAAAQRRRLATDLDLTARYVPASATVLDVGAVPLLLTAALAGRGYRVTGCDLAPERYRTAIAALGLRVERCDIETQPLPFADASFDAVLFNELFEHLRINPVFTMREVLRVLRPGGTLLLSSPNLRSLYGLRNFLLRNRAYSCSADPFVEYGKLERLGHMGHVREYTTTELRGFLNDVGFEVRSVVYRGVFRNPAARALATLVPPLRPFVTYVGVRP